jgi:hypothetical protein
MRNLILVSSLAMYSPLYLSFLLAFSQHSAVRRIVMDFYEAMRTFLIFEAVDERSVLI